jgi:hypothetical protein
VSGEAQTFVGQLVEAANAVDPLDLDDDCLVLHSLLLGGMATGH